MSVTGDGEPLGHLPRQGIGLELDLFVIFDYKLILIKLINEEILTKTPDSLKDARVLYTHILTINRPLTWCINTISAVPSV